jgi:AraC-like DNA-binding protein
MSGLSKNMCEVAVLRQAHVQLLSMLKRVPASHHFRVHAAYDVRAHAAWRFAEETIGDQHLFFVHSGGGRYWIEGEKYPIGRGLLVWLTHGIRRAATPDSLDLPSFVSLRFGLHRNADAVPAEQLVAPSYVVLPVSDAGLFEHLCSAVAAEAKREQTGDSCLNLSSAFVHCILGLLSIMLGTLLTGRPNDGRIERVRRRIDAQPLERVPVRTMARQAGLSERYFGCLFREQTGLSPKRYQVRARMHYARLLLRESGLSVKECAHQLGYPDPYNFSHHYRQQFGSSPSEDRRRAPPVP